jgi:hypothetical protein
MTSNLNKWDCIYRVHKAGDYTPYGSPLTYNKAAEWLKDCALIEDWGAGRAFFSTCFPKGKVVSIDATPNGNLDKVADMEVYGSRVPGILIRHMLCHNYGWATILENALNSFTKRMCVVIYTPFVDDCFWKVLEIIEHWNDIPVIAFNREYIEKIIKKHLDITYTIEADIPAGHDYHVEHVIYMEKK